MPPPDWFEHSFIRRLGSWNLQERVRTYRDVLKVLEHTVFSSLQFGVTPLWVTIELIPDSSGLIEDVRRGERAWAIALPEHRDTVYRKHLPFYDGDAEVQAKDWLTPFHLLSTLKANALVVMPDEAGAAVPSELEGADVEIVKITSLDWQRYQEATWNSYGPSLRVQRPDGGHSDKNVAGFFQWLATPPKPAAYAAVHVQEGSFEAYGYAGFPTTNIGPAEILGVRRLVEPFVQRTTRTLLKRYARLAHLESFWSASRDWFRNGDEVNHEAWKNPEALKAIARVLRKYLGPVEEWFAEASAVSACRAIQAVTGATARVNGGTHSLNAYGAYVLMLLGVRAELPDANMEQALSINWHVQADALRASALCTGDRRECELFFELGRELGPSRMRECQFETPEVRGVSIWPVLRLPSTTVTQLMTRPSGDAGQCMKIILDLSVAAAAKQASVVALKGEDPGELQLALIPAPCGARMFP